MIRFTAILSIFLLAACSSSDGVDSTTDTSYARYDSGTETDSGTEPIDTGNEPTDTGTEPTDTGTEPTDTGTEPTDTDTGSTDTGNEPTDTGTEPTDTDTGSTDTGTVSSGLPSSGGNPDSLTTGTRKTITIDGENTANEWGDDTLLILDPAGDEARFLGNNWTAHEPPWDYVALHGAWDDSNLYIGIQFVNITDVLDPANLGSSEGSQIHGMDLVQFLVFDTIAGEGYSTGGDMWAKDQVFLGDNQPDAQLYFHSNFSQEGTYLSRWDGAALTQTTDGLLTPGLTGAGGEFFVGTTLMGVDPGSDNDSPGEYGPSNIDYIGDRGHSTAYDTFFEVQIPFESIGIAASTLDNATIGIFAANGDGNAVDSIPNDPATSSTPGTSDSNSPLEWRATDDDDEYTVPFARVGSL